MYYHNEAVALTETSLRRNSFRPRESVRMASVKDTKVGVYFEIKVHSCAVSSIFESPREDTLITAGEDGAVFTLALTKAKWTNIEYSKIGEGTDVPEDVVEDGEDDEEDSIIYNNQILLMGVEEMEEHIEEVNTLKKKIVNIQTSTEYKINQIDTKFREEAKMSSDRFEKTLSDEKRYEALRLEFDDKVKTLLAAIEEKETDSVKVVTTLENRMSTFLADQLDRHDRLAKRRSSTPKSVKVCSLADRTDFTKQLNETVHQARLREKRCALRTSV